MAMISCSVSNREHPTRSITPTAFLAQFRAEAGLVEGAYQKTNPRLQDCWRSDHPALRRSRLRERQAPVLENARVEPFSDQTEQHSVAYPVPQKVPQVSMVQSV